MAILPPRGHCQYLSMMRRCYFYLVGRATVKPCLIVYYPHSELILMGTIKGNLCKWTLLMLIFIKNNIVKLCILPGLICRFKKQFKNLHFPLKKKLNTYFYQLLIIIVRERLIGSRKQMQGYIFMTLDLVIDSYILFKKKQKRGRASYIIIKYFAFEKSL